MTTVVQSQILQRQSTFWDFQTGSGVQRVHFIGKEEFGFSDSNIADFGVTDEHPLLIDYCSSWEGIFITGQDSSSRRTVALLEKAISGYVLGWRSPYSYLTATDPVRMLNEGHGRLAYAPLPIAEAIAEVLRAVDVPNRSMAGQPPRWPRKALVAGPNYVVAADFRFEELSSN